MVVDGRRRAGHVNARINPTARTLGGCLKVRRPLVGFAGAFRNPSSSPTTYCFPFVDTRGREGKGVAIRRGTVVLLTFTASHVSHASRDQPPRHLSVDEGGHDIEHTRRYNAVP